MGKEYYEKNKKQIIEKQKIYNKEHSIEYKQYIGKYHRINKEYVLNYKLTHPCTICGESDPICLDFHHTGDDKKNTVSNLIYKGNLESLISEIQKCDVLCANCHRKIHRKELGCTATAGRSLGH